MKNKNCDLCFTGNPIFKKVLDKGEACYGKNNDLALPIRLEKEVIGVLYLQGREQIVLSDNERKTLGVITSTAAILITTARDYENKIKQSAAFYEVGKLSAKTRDFREWFNPIMENVMDIIGRENRNFHLVMVEEEDSEKKLVVRATSPLFMEGEYIFIADKLLGLEQPFNSSLSGVVIRTGKTNIIRDIDKNVTLDDNDPEKIPYYQYTFEVKSEVGIPLKIKEGDTEKVIGVLIIDSVLPNDFQNFDLEFHETIASYLAVAIHNLNK